LIFKILGSLVIIGACSFVGHQISNELRGRVKTLEGWQCALLQIENYICFTKMPLAEIYKQQSTIKGEVGDFFKKLLQYDVQRVDTKALWNKEIEKIPYMTKEDKDILLMLAENLGTSITETQVNTIELIKKNIEQNLFEAKENEKRDAKMYKTISFFTGVGIAILLC